MYESFNNCMVVYHMAFYHAIRQNLFVLGIIENYHKFLVKLIAKDG